LYFFIPKNIYFSRLVVFVRGKIPDPPERPAYLKKFTALSILKLGKFYKATFLVKCLNKKCYFVNIFSSFKIMGVIEDINITL